MNINSDSDNRVNRKGRAVSTPTSQQESHGFVRNIIARINDLNNLKR